MENLVLSRFSPYQGDSFSSTDLCKYANQQSTSCDVYCAEGQAKIFVEL